MLFGRNRRSEAEKVVSLVMFEAVKEVADILKEVSEKVDLHEERMRVSSLSHERNFELICDLDERISNIEYALERYGEPEEEPMQFVEDNEEKEEREPGQRETSVCPVCGKKFVDRKNYKRSPKWRMKNHKARAHAKRDSEGNEEKECLVCGEVLPKFKEKYCCSECARRGRLIYSRGYHAGKKKNNKEE